MKRRRNKLSSKRKCKLLRLDACFQSLSSHFIANFIQNFLSLANRRIVANIFGSNYEFLVFPGEKISKVNYYSITVSQCGERIFHISLCS